ncbi:Retrovirus-related Pol polyprotein from transposon RE1 [Vitis vinifera]|uniref:Retrovirus-related Pol polyprotein from transposon RE1 n=1 Tax=Vitis vinifera TaxID=29760 RepID=A0A438CAS6_VITVI|nr:Retrovirus-related Pol polyprotein from transposon RE1 [Vitis vinifera]
MIETQYNAKVRVLRSDNGGEYQSSDLQKYLEGHGIIHQTTCSNTTQQNRVAERKNRHLLEVVSCFLNSSKNTRYLIGRSNHIYRILDQSGEYHKEIQTLDYDYHISEEDEFGQSELVNQEVECPPGKKPVGVSLDLYCEVQDRWMHGVRKAMLEGVQIEEVIVWVEAIPESMVWKVHKVNESFWLSSKKKSSANYLSREFEMKDLGPLKYFLGIEVSRSSEGIFLSQRKYALDLLQETGMSGCQPVNTPIEEGLKLCVEPNQVSTDKGRYQRLVGRLMYLAHTRPDLAYALSVVSQYMHNPGEQHMNAVMRILRYLKNAPGKGILFAKNVDHQSIEVYTDADWAGAVDDRRSTSGYFTFVGGNLVTWKSKKQNVVARSSAEAEFRGMALGLCEALWLRLLLQDLGYLSRQPIRLFCDNKAACDIAHNPVQHDRTKHVEVDRFFIKEKLDDKIVELPKIRSEDQLADILTKAVSSQEISGYDLQIEALPVGSIAFDSAVTALLYWQGKLFIGCADRIIKEQDKRIEELTAELENASQRCEAYRASLLAALKDMEGEKLKIAVKVHNTRLNLKG